MSWKLSTKELFGLENCEYNLYPFQATCVQWARRIQYNVGLPGVMSGGILADEMGLGKTMMGSMIVASNILPSTLIATIPNIRYIWIDTILKFGINVSVYTIEGDKIYYCFLKTNEDGTRSPDKRPLNTKRGEEIIEPFVMVCNSDLITKGIKNDKIITSRVWWNIMIDEAAFLRNENDSWHKLNRLIQPTTKTPYGEVRIGTRFLITATPIQMGISDLKNLFKFIDGRFLQGKTEKEWINELKYLISTNLFRRTAKNLTQEMKNMIGYPEKEAISKNIVISLKSSSYSDMLEKMSLQVMINECKNNPNLVNAILTDEKCYMIAKVTEAKFQDSSRDYAVLRESGGLREMISYPFSYPPYFITDIMGSSAIYKGNMGKFDTLKQIMNHHINKPLVCFHHYDVTGKEICNMVKTNYPHYKVLAINGTVSSDLDRYNILQDANKTIKSGNPVILVSSTMATAEGTNYQEFSLLVMFDPEYNQKTDEQAKNRVQRIGQKNQVYTYDLILDNFNTFYGVVSVDKHIQGKQDERKHLSDIIDDFNAAHTFRRYTIEGPNGKVTTGINFGEEYETNMKGMVGGPDSVGPLWIN